MRHFRDETTEKEIYRDPPSAFSKPRSAKRVPANTGIAERVRMETVAERWDFVRPARRRRTSISLSPADSATAISPASVYNSTARFLIDTVLLRTGVDGSIIYADWFAVAGTINGNGNQIVALEGSALWKRSRCR